MSDFVLGARERELSKTDMALALRNLPSLTRQVPHSALWDSQRLKCFAQKWLPWAFLGSCAAPELAQPVLWNYRSLGSAQGSGLG